MLLSGYIGATKFCLPCSLASLSADCRKPGSTIHVAPTSLHANLQCENETFLLYSVNKTAQFDYEFNIAILPDWVSGEQEDAHEFLLGVFEQMYGELPVGVGRLAFGNRLTMVLKAAKVKIFMFASFGRESSAV